MKSNPLPNSITRDKNCEICDAALGSLPFARAAAAGCIGLSNIANNLPVPAVKPCRPRSSTVTGTLSTRLSESQPYTLYEALFYKLLTRCQKLELLQLAWIKFDSRLALGIAICLNKESSSRYLGELNKEYF